MSKRSVWAAARRVLDRPSPSVLRDVSLAGTGRRSICVQAGRRRNRWVLGRGKALVKNYADSPRQRKIGLQQALVETRPGVPTASSIPAPFQREHDVHLQHERGSSRKKKAYTRDDDAVELDEIRATPWPRRLVSHLVHPKQVVPVVVLSSVRHVKPGSVLDKGHRVSMLSRTKEPVPKDVL